MWKLVLAGGVCLGLSACASTGSKNYRPAALVGPGNDIDTEKIEKVTRWAHDHGAKLIWLSYPVKPIPRPATPAGS